MAGPAGTVFDACDYVVHDDTTGADVATGCGTLSAGGATLTMPLNRSSPVHAGDHLTAAWRKVTNPAAGTYALSVSTSSDPVAVTSASYTVTAGGQRVSAVTAPTLSTTAAAATAVEYTGVGFTVSPTGQLSPDGATITVAAPAGTVFDVCDYVVHDDTTGADVATGCGTLSAGGATLTMPLNRSSPVHAGDHLTAAWRKVTNPAAGTYALSVSTSSDPVAVTSASYTVTAGGQSVSGVSTAVSTAAPSASGVEYRVNFTVSPTGELSPDGATITVAGPAGTVFDACDYVVHDDTTGADVATGCGTLSAGGATLTMPLNRSSPVHAGDHLTATLRKVTNPASMSSTLAVATSSDRAPVTSSPYTAPLPPVPSVSGLNPASGPFSGATMVTVTGSGFTGADAVHFGSALASTFTIVSDTQITATSPTGTGTVDVTVTTPGGTSASSTADRFTYGGAPAPAVTALSPTSGPAAGATAVTITGTGFTGATAVKFGASPATNVTAVSDTQITATSPAGTGTVDVTVTTPGGTSAIGTADRFTYNPAPGTTTTTTTVPVTTTTTTVPATTTTTTTSVPATTTTTVPATATTAVPATTSTTVPATTTTTVSATTTTAVPATTTNTASASPGG